MGSEMCIRDSPKGCTDGGSCHHGGGSRAATSHGESLVWWRSGGVGRQGILPWVGLSPGNRTLPVPWCCGWLGGEGGAVMSTSSSGGAEACEHLGSGGLGRPRWDVVAAGGWEVGAGGARSIAKTITIVFDVASLI